MRIQKIFTVIVLIGFFLFPFDMKDSVQASKQKEILTGPDVLLLAVDSGSTPIQTLLLAYGDLGSVDVFIVAGATPTLLQLLNYDVVLIWNNGSFFNSVGIGDVLADYVDSGGKVINLNFSMGDIPRIEGRFLIGDYSAMIGTTIYYKSDCLGSYNPLHPIMIGITNVCDFYRMNGTHLTTESSTIASYADGLILVAAKDNRTVVSINSYIGSVGVWTGQMDDLIHNAILWLTSENISYLPLILK